MDTSFGTTALSHDIISKNGMKYRPLGRTGCQTSILGFGGKVLERMSQPEADKAVGYALDQGINTFDVAPTYGDAELRLGKALGARRKEVILACKVAGWTRAEASTMLQKSLNRLGTDYIDIYQFQGLDSLDDLDVVIGPGGAWEAFMEAKEKGLVRFLGITGHRPTTHLEALRRMALDVVMCPINFIQTYHIKTTKLLLEYAAQHKIGIMAIKMLYSGTWQNGEEHNHRMWYRPFEEPELIMNAFRFALSQPIATAIAPTDLNLLAPLLSAVQNFIPLTTVEQENLVGSGAGFEPLFNIP